MKRSLVIGVALLALSSCTGGTLGGLVVSQETSEQAKQVLCHSSDSLVSQLQAGGAGARAAALLVRDNSKNEDMKKVATLIAEGRATPEDFRRLTTFLQDLCK